MDAPVGFIALYVSNGPGYGGYERTFRLEDIAGTEPDGTYFSVLTLKNGGRFSLQRSVESLHREIDEAYARLEQVSQTPEARLEALERRVERLEGQIAMKRDREW